MKKKMIAMLMAIALVATNAGFNELGNSVVHAASGESCGLNEADHKNVTCTYKWKTDATCVATIQCDDCDFEVEKDCEVAKKVVKEVSCTEDGEVEYTATVTFGGAKYTNEQTLSETVKAAGHVEKITKEAKEATCTEAGNTEEISCKNCGIILEASETVKAKGHVEAVAEGKEPTCMEDGYTEETYCSVCDAVLVPADVIPGGHVYEADEFIWNGYSECIAVIGCENCDFSVEVECKTIVLDKIDATCTTDGYDLYTAKVTYEGQTFESEMMGDESAVKPKLGHNYKDNVCARCGEAKPFAEVVFTDNASVKTYTGETLSVEEDIYEVKKGSGDVFFEYYLDENCEIPTYAGDEGKEATAPVEPGMYFVKAIITDDEDYRANVSESVHEFKIRPGRVASLKAVNNKTTIKLTWDKCEEADGYIIYKKVGDAEYQPLVYIEDNETLSYSDDVVYQAKKYRYNIVSYKIADNGEEVCSLKRKNGTNIIRARITALNNLNGGVKLKWTKIEGVAGYKVYRKIYGEDSYTLIKNIKDDSENTYTDKSSSAIKNGKISYYYIKPYYSEKSSVVLQTNKRTNYHLTRTSISSLAASGSKALTVKWAKNSKATGYEIRYSRNSDMEDATKIIVESNETLSKKISKLTAGKTYYVQVRSYKTYQGTDFYSAWSAKKSVKTN